MGTCSRGTIENGSRRVPKTEPQHAPCRRPQRNGHLLTLISLCDGSLGNITLGEFIVITASEVINHDACRPIQREVINAALDGHDVFLQAATSFGKSLCFQLPAVVDHGSKPKTVTDAVKGCG